MFFLSQLLLVLSAYICFLPSALRYNFSYLPRFHVYAELRCLAIARRIIHFPLPFTSPIDMNTFIVCRSLLIRSLLRLARRGEEKRNYVKRYNHFLDGVLRFTLA